MVIIMGYSLLIFKSKQKLLVLINSSIWLTGLAFNGYEYVRHGDALASSMQKNCFFSPFLDMCPNIHIHIFKCLPIKAGSERTRGNEKKKIVSVSRDKIIYTCINNLAFPLASFSMVWRHALFL